MYIGGGAGLGGGGKFGSGGGGGGGSGDGRGKRDNRHISENEKFALKGVFARDTLAYLMPSLSGQSALVNPLASINAISWVRELLDQPEVPFEAAFDLEDNSLHYYAPGGAGNKWLAIADQIGRKEKGVVESGVFEGRFDVDYVHENVITDLRDKGYNSTETKLPEGSIFASDATIREYLKSIILSDNSEGE